jgi:hypothetical protein
MITITSRCTSPSSQTPRQRRSLGYLDLMKGFASDLLLSSSWLTRGFRRYHMPMSRGGCAWWLGFVMEITRRRKVGMNTSRWKSEVSTDTLECARSFSLSQLDSVSRKTKLYSDAETPSNPLFSDSKHYPMVMNRRSGKQAPKNWCK